MIEERDSQTERARGQVYEFFSALLLNPPAAEMLARALDEDGVKAWEAIFPDQPACARLRELSRAYRRGEWQAEDFLFDYEALFRVPGNSYVHPFESVYCHESFSRGKMKGCTVLAEQARDVGAIYRKHGLSPREGFTELPDHLGVELELMAVLCRKTAEALQEGNRRKAACLASEQRAFLSDHLLRWGPLCLRKIRVKAGTPFYLCLAELLEAFLEEEDNLNSYLFKSASG